MFTCCTLPYSWWVHQFTGIQYVLKDVCMSKNFHFLGAFQPHNLSVGVGPKRVTVQRVHIMRWTKLVQIIIIFITVMQGICNYVPDTNRVSRVYNVAAVLYLQFLLQVMLFRAINFLYFTLVLHALCVQCPIWLFSVASRYCAFKALLLLFYIVSCHRLFLPNSSPLELTANLTAQASSFRLQ